MTTAWSEFQRKSDIVFRHPTLRVMVPVFSGDTMVLWWQAPSGRWLRFVENEKSHRGLGRRIRRLYRGTFRLVGVGGFFFQQDRWRGTVNIRFVRPVRQVFYGVRPVKLDGMMPIFSATVLPRHRNDRLRVYKLWGAVRTSYELANNELVCLFGTWFEFSDRALGIVQQEGVLGHALLRFAESYQFARRWNAVWWRRSWLLFYQVTQRMAHKQVVKWPRVPILSQLRSLRYRALCQKRLTSIQRRNAFARDVLYEWDDVFWQLPHHSLWLGLSPTHLHDPFWLPWLSPKHRLPGGVFPGE